MVAGSDLEVAWRQLEESITIDRVWNPWRGWAANKRRSLCETITTKTQKRDESRATAAAAVGAYFPPKTQVVLLLEQHTQ